MAQQSIAEIMARGGVLTDGAFAELRRWRLPGVPQETPEPVPLDTPEQAAAAHAEMTQGIEQALQERDIVLVRITDPDLLAQYTNSRVEGLLRVQIGTEQADFPIVFGRTVLGEYIIPWSSDALEEALERCDAWLSAPEEIHFRAANVFSYGQDKAFIVCVAVGAA